MQLVEYFTWNNLHDKKTNRLISQIAFICYFIFLAWVYYAYHESNTWGLLWCWVANIHALGLIGQVFFERSVLLDKKLILSKSGGFRVKNGNFRLIRRAIQNVCKRIQELEGVYAEMWLHKFRV